MVLLRTHVDGGVPGREDGSGMGGDDVHATVGGEEGRYLGSLESFLGTSSG